MEQKRESLPERHEKKYWINRGDLLTLRQKLDPVLKHDSHANEDGNYHIRSLYFDDIYNSAYYDKVEGNADRDKYRIRIYNLSDEVIFLERKRKAGSLIQKSACRITRELAQALIDRNPTPLLKTDNALLLDMYVQMRTKLLHPVVLVDYVREAYIHPIENTRITFDKQLATCPGSTDLFNKRLLTLSPVKDEREILEIKYDRHLPDFIAKLIGGTPAEYTAISKYVLCRSFEPLGGQ
ncbi:MAG: polyphosphate polymerase domain-containing protein [Clostridia bacterium]|nr:polyphosphate polymerase domain-containing protein [Clostridia bacterium]